MMMIYLEKTEEEKRMEEENAILEAVARKRNNLHLHQR